MTIDELIQQCEGRIKAWQEHMHKLRCKRQPGMVRHIEDKMGLANGNFKQTVSLESQLERACAKSAALQVEVDALKESQSAASRRVRLLERIISELRGDLQFERSKLNLYVEAQDADVLQAELSIEMLEGIRKSPDQELCTLEIDWDVCMDSSMMRIALNLARKQILEKNEWIEKLQLDARVDAARYRIMQSLVKHRS